MNCLAISLTCSGKPSCSDEMVHNDCWVVIYWLFALQCFSYDLASYLNGVWGDITQQINLHLQVCSHELVQININATETINIINTLMVTHWDCLCEYVAALRPADSYFWLVLQEFQFQLTFWEGCETDLLVQQKKNMFGYELVWYLFSYLVLRVKVKCLMHIWYLFDVMEN